MNFFSEFIGPAYQLDSKALDVQRSVNWFLRAIESGKGKDGAMAALVDRAGYSEKVSVGAGLPQRGSWATTTGVYYTVNGSKLFKVDSSWTATEIGTLDTSTGHVSITDNGTDLVIVDGSNAYKNTLATDTFVKLTDADLVSFNQVVYLDGYFVFFGADKVQSSNLLSTDVDALDFATSEGSPDDIVGGIALERKLYIFNEETTEIYFNAGGTSFPFSRIEGAFLELGCAARHSIQKSKDAVFFLAKDRNGSGLIYMAKGANMQRISNHVIEQKINSYGDVSNARAFVYQDEGSTFYQINFDNVSTTWVYDMTTGAWHERVYLNDGVEERDRGYSHAYAYSTHLVGDYENGSIYEMSRDYKTDNGEEFPCYRVSPHISSGGKLIKYKALQAVMESGTGLDGTGQGTDPQAMLQISNDGGRTFGTELWQSLGKIGETQERVKWNRLGQSRDRVFKLQVSDPVRRVLTGIYLDLETGIS